MKKRYFIYCLLLMPLLVKGQGFEKIFGSEIRDYGVKAVEVPGEDAYLVFAQMGVAVSSDWGVGVTKLDTDGNIIWEKYDSTEATTSRTALEVTADGFRRAVSYYADQSIKIRKYNNEGEFVNQVSYFDSIGFYYERLMFLSDGALLVLGNNPMGDGFVLHKISPDGTLLWKTENIDSQFNLFHIWDMYETPEGEIIMIAKHFFANAPSFFAKFDAQGNYLWRYTLPPNLKSSALTIPFPENDAYFIWGHDDWTGKFSYVAKVNSDGQEAWSKLFNDHVGIVRRKGILYGEDNSLYISGEIFEGNKALFFLLRLGADGNVIWEKHYEAFQWVQEGQLLRDSDGSFIIVAESYATLGNNPKPYIFKTDSLGNLLWTWHSDNEDFLGFSDATLLPNKGLLALGVAEGENGDAYQNYLVKLDSSNVDFISAVSPNPYKPDLIKLYPQPADDMVYFELKSNGSQQPYRLEVFNLLGQRIHEQTIKEGVNTVSHLPAGQHFYRLWQEGAVAQMGKVVVK
ncbi:MAG: T9SS type A sorting domain-containing protein [Bacteroidetes bacterium]|nr:T9SS type A sorting domain-containing protein [Bacteroidota bacterium]